MIRKTYNDAYPSSHHSSLWGYVALLSIAKACLLGLTSEGWSGHEVFYTVAPEICWEGALEEDSRFERGEREKRKEGYARLGTVDLVKRFYPDAKIDPGWWKENPRRGCFDCRKAERLLGWVHEDGL